MWGSSIVKCMDACKSQSGHTSRVFIRNQQSRQAKSELALPCRPPLCKGRPKTTVHPACSLGSALPADAKSMLYTLLADWKDIANAVDSKSTWFLIRGSLRGAIRERALIPWDDDVDVMLLLDGVGTKSQRLHNFWTKVFPTYVAAFETRGWLAFQAGTHLVRVTPLIGKEAVSAKERWQACKDAVVKLKPDLSRAECFRRASEVYTDAQGQAIMGGFLRLDLHIASPRPKSGDVVLHNDQSKASARVPSSMLLPTKLAKFGKLQVNVPQKPEAVLESCYGPMWVERDRQLD